MSLHPLMISKAVWDGLAADEQKAFEDAAEIADRAFEAMQQEAEQKAVEAFHEARREGPQDEHRRVRGLEQDRQGNRLAGVPQDQPVCGWPVRVAPDQPGSIRQVQPITRRLQERRVFSRKRWRYEGSPDVSARLVHHVSSLTSAFLVRHRGKRQHTAAASRPRSRPYAGLV